jgi:hypothetical protein
VLPELVRRVGSGGLYLGVGPEQNFTYIAAIRPRMAFIIDIRRGNLHQHLLYKALFEMSKDRADFVTRLFVRERRSAVGPHATAAELFGGLDQLPASTAQYDANLSAVIGWLTTRHGFPLESVDRDGIDYVYRQAFFADGPGLNYRMNGRMGRGRRGMPSYADLMSATDDEGRQWSYLATEANFAFVKALHERNLIVPLVGDFGGPKALRTVGRYAHERAAVVTALYVSNVEQYLRPDGKWDAFCANVASMPLARHSTFIRSVRGGGGAGGFRSSLGSMQAETRACAGRRSARAETAIRFGRGDLE